MYRKALINMCLISLNIIFITVFVIPIQWTPFLIIFLLIISQYKTKDIRSTMQIVAIISILSIFIPFQFTQQLFSVSALALAMNIGYHIDFQYSNQFINASLALGVIFLQIFHKISYQEIITLQNIQNNQESFINANIVLPHTITQKNLLLIFTIGNLYLPQKTQPLQSAKILFVLNPLFDESYVYAIGYLMGVMLVEVIKIPKYIKIFLVAGSLFFEIFFIGSQIISVFIFLRGLFVFSLYEQFCQKAFLIGFLIVKIIMDEYLKEYMFIGYLIVGVLLWQKYYDNNKQLKYKRQNQVEMNQLHHNLIDQHNQK